MNRKLVIDISHWNGDINLARWKAERGIWGVIIKAGGYEKLGGTYQQYKDSKFEANYAKAKALNLHIGAYYYDVCTTTAQAKKNAEHFASLLKGKKFDLPCYQDVEDAGQFRLSKRALTDVIKAFCDTLNAKGYKAGIYTGGNAWLNNMHRNELYKYADWIAAWRASWPSYAEDGGKIGMWQQGSMRLSDGDIKYDWVSGYVDCDWCVIDYPNQGKEPASNGATLKALTYAERIAQVATYIANRDTHGYSQPHRSGDGTTEKAKFSDGTYFVVHGGDYDCSEMARVCANCALTGTYTSPIPDMWTGNEDQRLKAQGFKRIPFSVGAVKRGDILWVKGHTGVALGNGLQADAHGDEYGGITGPRRGDQTGHEIEVRSLRSSWVYIYRREGTSPFKPASPQKPSRVENDFGLHYRAHVETYGWLASVRDGQVAGTTGKQKRLEALKITPPEGVTLDVTAHIQGVGDKSYRGIVKGKSSGTGSSKNDPIIGTVGKGKRIEGICVDVVKNTNPKLNGKTLYYRVHVQKQGWTSWCKAGTYAGTRGKELRVEAVQMAFR